MIKVARVWVSVPGLWGGLCGYAPRVDPSWLVAPAVEPHMSQSRAPEVAHQPCLSKAPEFLRGHHPFVLGIVCQS